MSRKQAITLTTMRMHPQIEQAFNRLFLASASCFCTAKVSIDARIPSAAGTVNRGP
jgi:hypothetical protein